MTLSSHSVHVVEIAFGSDADVVLGYRWQGVRNAILLLHDQESDCSTDSWQTLPERLHAAGLTVLVIDLPGFGGSASSTLPDAIQRAAGAAVNTLRENGALRVFLATAGSSSNVVDSLPADALILISPEPGRSSGQPLSLVPKLIVAGSQDAKRFAEIKGFASQCRGWSVLSSFATADQAHALMSGQYSSQIQEQIVAFLRDYTTSD